MAKDRFFQGFTAYPLRTFRLLTHLGRLIALSYLLHDIKMMNMKSLTDSLTDKQPWSSSSRGAFATNNFTLTGSKASPVCEVGVGTGAVDHLTASLSLTSCLAAQCCTK